MRWTVLAWMALLLMPWEGQAAELPADLDPSIRQFVPHLKQMLKNELQFALRVCAATPEQALKIETACLASFPQLLQKLSDQHQQMQRGRAVKEVGDARQLIVASIAAAVKETLPADACDRYSTELQKRADARRHAAVVNIVAQLDRLLVLTAEQRARLLESLNANWKEDWNELPEALQFGVDYLPPVPEELVAPVLSAKQREVWRALPKQGRIHFGLAGLGLVQWIEVQGNDVIDVEVQP